MPQNHKITMDKDSASDGIIFDVDGTLWDSTEQVAISWTQGIRENSDLDMNLTGECIKCHFGKTMDAITAALFPSLSLKDRKKLGDICFEYENAYLAEHPGILFPHVREVFELLSEKFDLYIVSNCQCGYIEVFLESTGLGGYIKDHLCFGRTLRPKNETIRILMEKHHLENVVYIGDTLGDFDACRKADIPFIFAEYGFGEAPEADIRIKDIAELPALLLNSGKVD